MSSRLAEEDDAADVFVVLLVRVRSLVSRSSSCAISRAAEVVNARRSSDVRVPFENARK